MKITLLSIYIFLGILSCNNGKKLATIIGDLYNQNDSVRYKGLEKLAAYDLTLNQQILLLNTAKDKFPKAKYEWESIPGKIIEIATKNPDTKLVEVIRNNFKDYDTIGKNASLRFLSGFNNNASIQAFIDLILKHPSEVSFFSTGILEKDYSYKDLIFPDLLNVIDHETLDADILLLLLNYLNNNQIQAKDYVSYIDKLLALSKKYRNILEDKQSLNVNTWDDGEYQNARYKSGIIEDLSGHFYGNQVIAELTNYLKINDQKIRMFSVISLIKLGQNIDSAIVNEIAADVESRKWFFENLQSLRKESIFPSRYKTQEAFAESDIINWLLYPTELGRMPDAIELMQVVQVDSESDDGMVEFYLFRFKSNHEDWIDNGWMAGVSGYFPVKFKPSVDSYGYTFSTFEKWDAKIPDEHVKEIRDLIKKSWEEEK
jgi:hypothetical protein